jgi:hypothetical protein
VSVVFTNPYHISTLRHVGRRFALDTGQVGGIVLKHPAGAPPPDLLPRLRRELQRGQAGPPGEGVITWPATRITLHGTAAQLPAGIDGEAVLLNLPNVCEIRPRALQVLLPRPSARHPDAAHAPAVRQPDRRPI